MGYQGGKYHVGPCHIYENLFKPKICPVIQLKGYKPLRLRPNGTKQQENRIETILVINGIKRKLVTISFAILYATYRHLTRKFPDSNNRK